MGEAGAEEAEKENVVDREEDERSLGDGMMHTGVGVSEVRIGPHESSDSRCGLSELFVVTGEGRPLSWQVCNCFFEVGLYSATWIAMRHAMVERFS